MTGPGANNQLVAQLGNTRQPWVLGQALYESQL